MIRAFLDDGLIKDILFKEGSYDETCRIMSMAEKGEIEGWISCLLFVELSEHASEDQLRKIYAILARTLRICDLNVSDLRKAMRSQDIRKGIAMSLARKAKADFIISEDTKGFINSRIEVMKPALFLARLENGKEDK